MKTLLVAAAFALGGAVAFAQESKPAPDEYEDHLGLGIPSLRVTGSLATEVWYDDNILLSRDDKESDFVTVLAPEMHAKLGDDDNHLWADYRGRDRQFNANTRFDGMEHYLDGALRFGGVSSSHLGTYGVHIDVWSSLQDRNDPFSLPGETKRIDWLQGEAGIGIDAEVVPLVELELKGELRRFEIADTTFDRFDHRRKLASVLVATGIMKDAQALIEVGAARTGYDEGVLDDFVLWWGVGGIRGSLADNVQIMLKAGGFSTDVTQFSGTIESASITGIYVAAAATWQPIPEGELTLQMQRRPVESIYTGWMIVERYETSCRFRLGDRVMAGLGLYYETVDESRSGEDRKAYGGNADLNWAISRHFSLNGGVDLRAKRSRFHTFDYDDARYFLGATVGW